MQTIPDSDDDSARITPKLSKIVSSASQLNHLSKVGSSVVVPVNVSNIYDFLVLWFSISFNLFSSLFLLILFSNLL